MGLLSSLTGGDLLSAGSSIGSSVINGLFQNHANKQAFKNQLKIMQKNDEYQRSLMEDTPSINVDAYQKAGLSVAALSEPMKAVSSNAQGSAPPVVAPQVENPVAAMLSMHNMRLQNENIQASTDKLKAEAAQTQANTAKLEADTKATQMANTEQYISSTYRGNALISWLQDLSARAADGKDVSVKIPSEYKTLLDTLTSMKAAGKDVLVSDDFLSSYGLTLRQGKIVKMQNAVSDNVTNTNTLDAKTNKEITDNPNLFQSHVNEVGGWNATNVAESTVNVNNSSAHLNNVNVGLRPQEVALKGKEVAIKGREVEVAAQKLALERSLLPAQLQSISAGALASIAQAGLAKIQGKNIKSLTAAQRRKTLNEAREAMERAAKEHVETQSMPKTVWGKWLYNVTTAIFTLGLGVGVQAYSSSKGKKVTPNQGTTVNGTGTLNGNYTYW